MPLLLDWCSHAAALHSVTRWHYSGTMPAGKNVKIGVWEDGRFIGVVIFGTGAGPQIACPFGMDRLDVYELVRVALGPHSADVSKIIAIAIRMLRKQSRGLRLIVSFADPEQGHLGTVYQAGNWIYVGRTKPTEHFETSSGRRIHSKTLRTGRRGYATRMLAAGSITSVRVWKHKYVMPLDDGARSIVAKMRHPYPKRAGSTENDAPADQAGEGGVIPTPALQ